MIRPGLASIRTLSPMPNPDQEARGELTRAWWAWNLFGAGAVVTLAVAVVDTANDPIHEEAGAAGWLLLPGAAWAFLLVPAVLVLKSGVLLAAWQSKPADAEGYRRGLILVWAVLEVGVVLCCIPTMVSEQLLPGGILAGLLTMALLALRPSADAVSGPR